MHRDLGKVNFLLQTDLGGFPNEANTVRELIAAENAWYGEDRYSFSTLAEKAEESDVPVGSVEFCNLFAERIGAPPLPALNVPKPLRGEHITGRKCYDFANEDQLRAALQESPNGFIVKPGDYAKRFDAFKVHRAEYFDLRDKPGPYFASEVLARDIEAEWRVFFYRGQIVCARPYLMHSWVAPTDLFAKMVLSEWGAAAPKAGTLDIAILLGGRNILLEAHPLIACGFYGFEDPVLLRMLRAAWEEHICKSGKSAG